MKNFWLEDEDQTYALKPVKRKDIIAAEKQLGVELPALYKKLVKKQNGGYIQRTLFPISFVTDHVEEFIEVRSLYGIGEDGILDTDYLIKEWGLPSDIVLLDGDGHTWVALDYRGKKRKPSVVYLEVEEGNEFQLAESFDEFIAALEEEEYDVEEEDMIDDMDIPDLDNISKREAEEIFRTSEDEILIRSVIINIPLAAGDMNWMLDQLIYLLKKRSTEGIAESVADFLLIYSRFRSEMDDSKYTSLMKKLRSLPYPGVKMDLEMIDENN
ncbi:SMI1/KNR4 family protein [Oceanobacillus luteolus]|uniref:SMI1/KNR4 family protein n=1 Tax=Oceanobacillus luteolus TaxID=1274358 RepID=A0ABW4HMC8_9BACI